ncbi:DegT/DnrJ/EryC1/StrS family aminotransferase [Deinococcus hopiensis]|uniref:dTDP-4-amino-4,6-dideoxygalactose transaminase n=1 Tax=Deinococcus hopiensis KR-140 TaxID=695939 RepID=A0A1W1UHA9_9DEIO|nr:DegT/DnrJ/EryC1/StrS family aminotransferase [Deinococcus hopiensis]SMB80457.1 dTDP-4-amino-4,6-dideoxygalactose transaminase [Deinococcus hopiensis KR-140]
MTSTERVQIPILDLSPEIDELWDELNAAIQRVLRSGHFIMGPDVTAFEEEVAAYLGVRHAVGVNSGTDALIIGLRALGIGPGDEVITTPFTFFATAESISSVGATPVFADIDTRSYNIDPARIREAITPRTKAIMPVHLYGNPCEMDEIMAIAREHNLLVIEDCAQSFGARYKGKQTGTIGHVGAYSFFPSKNLGAFGDGGLLTTDDDGVAEVARMLRAHGSRKKYHNEILGYNSRLDTIQAAILRVKLPHVDRWNEGRRQVAATYNELLADVPGVVTPEITEGHVFHQYTIRLTQADRDEAQGKLANEGIGTMVYYPVPQHKLPIYEDNQSSFIDSESVSRSVISLPISSNLHRSQIVAISDILSRI